LTYLCALAADFFATFLLAIILVDICFAWLGFLFMQQRGMTIALADGANYLDFAFFSLMSLLEALET
jgi:hypothetical protein